MKKYESGGEVSEYPKAIRKAAEAKAKKEYESNKENWPLNPKKAAYAANEAGEEAEREAQRESTRGIRPKGFKKGGKVSMASRRGDGIAIRGKTKAGIRG